jgi:very-short-patch-repair endonuclease
LAVDRRTPILGLVLDTVIAAQAGVITRRQALDHGLTDGLIIGHLRARRWQRLHPGIYAVFSGPLPRESALWAAVLRSGPSAMLSHEGAAELLGLSDPAGSAIHVTVPDFRRLRSRRGIVVHRSRFAARKLHPARTPPQTRVEETVIDLIQTSATLDGALGWLTRAIGCRLTTAPRLSRALRQRGRVRWRRELSSALRDSAAGCHSVLELRYARRVERAHRLPRAQRQRRRGRWYDDVSYSDYGVLVELDGVVAHPDGQRFRDHRRDNAAVVGGARVLRYGYADVTVRPCVVAREVASVLRAAGWSGRPRPCGPRCTLRGAFSFPPHENAPH